MTISDSSRLSRGRALLASLSLALALTTQVTTARADTDEQRAVAAFEKGRKLARDGRCVDAVAPLLESIRYAEGVGALLNLGNCYEALGKTASAYKYFARAREIASARNDPRAEEAGQRVLALEKERASLVIHVPAANRGSAEVHVDGASWGRDSWDIPVPLDPGTHSVEIHLPPGAASTRTVTLPKGERVDIDAVPPAAPAATPGTGTGTSTGTGTAREGEEGSETPAQRTVGLVLGGAGVLGLVTGGIFGAISLATHASILDRCPTYPTCSSTIQQTSGLDADNDRARTFGTVSTVAIVAGLVLVAGGAVLYLTAEPSKKKSASASRRALAGYAW